MGYKLRETEPDSDNNLNLNQSAKCRRASGYMMKYMDGEIDKAEAEWLRAHIAECPECHEDFLLYDMMVDGFTDAELIDAPDNFEEMVMLKIEALGIEEKPSAALKSAPSLDNIICAVWGVFSIIFGAGFLLFLNREQIIAAMEENENFALYLQIINPISKLVSEFTANLQVVFNNAVTTAASFVSDYRYVVLGIFAVLVIAQYIVKTRHNGINVAFAEEKIDKEKI